MNRTELEAVERNIEEAKVIVDLADALDRLVTLGDFKKVIKDGYFTKEAIRLVHLKADQSMQNPDSQKSILSQMDAIGNLNKYFETIWNRADIARKAIEYDEQTREELLVEELA